jgi:nucleoid-associated protein YgaU
MQQAAAAWLDVALLRALAVLGLLVVARFALPVVLRAAGALPGATGRAAGRLGRALRPGLARRLLALGLGLAAPGVPALAAHATTPVLAHDRAAATAPAAPSATRATPTPVPTRWVTVAPGDTLWDLARRHLHHGATDAEIARAWPRWYRANRTTIGPDPNLLLPGMRLRVPEDRPARGTAPRPAGTPAPHHRPATAPAVATSLDPDRR